LLVDLQPTVSIEEIDARSDSLGYGQSGSRRYRVACRWGRDGGRHLPEAVTVDDPLHAAFVGNVRERSLDGGLFEAERDVEVTIPASNEPGHRRAALRFSWADGYIQDIPISWKVSPPLQANPPGLVLKPVDGRIRRSILVHSSDVPFRITGVSGSLLAEPCSPSGESARSHVISLAIDPALATNADSPEIRITTDHPAQAELLFSVLVLPSDEGSLP